jgi:hypothetical protein
MKNIKLWEPWYFENSKLPIWLSKIAPIDVWAFSFAFWVCCRGEMKPRTRRHEAIHYQQQLEMLFVSGNGYVMEFAGLLVMPSIAMAKRHITRTLSSSRHMS